MMSRKASRVSRISKMSRMSQTPQRATPTEQSRATTRVSLLRPPNKSSIQKTRDFFWDRERKACMTRTPLNWLSISVYYFIFVAVVGAAFAVCMIVAMHVAEDSSDRPEYILDESPLGETPGMNFFPALNRRALIHLGFDGYDKYVKKITEIFDHYKQISSSFDPRGFNECGVAPFGYDKMAPCVYLRLNRLIAWRPLPYTPKDHLPDDVPKKVREKIKTGAKLVWVWCNGSQAKDRDHFSEDFFKIQGDGGFNPSFFPYISNQKYIDSIVAIKFEDVPDGVVYTVTCRAWAKKMDPSLATLDIVYYFE